MYLSKKQIEEIAQQIASISKKDSDFEETFELNGEDYVAIVQDGVNKKISGDLFRDELQNGPRGESAYEVAKRLSGMGENFPSEEEWLNDPINGIKGVGIANTEYTESTEQSGISVLKITYNTGEVITVHIKNGKGIVSVTGTESSESSGTNTWTMNLSDGTSQELHTKNGRGVTSITQEVVGYGSDADNYIKVNYSEGQSSSFVIRNGSQGNSGYTGAAGELEVVNNLTDGGATKALSAEQGKVLNEKFRTFQKTLITSYTSLPGKVVSDAGVIMNSDTYDCRMYNVTQGNYYTFSGDTTSTVTFYYINWFTENDEFISHEYYSTYNVPFSYRDQVIKAPANAAKLYINIQRPNVLTYNVKNAEYKTGQQFYESTVKIADIVNTLDSSSTSKPLSAAQGKLLNERVRASIPGSEMEYEEILNQYVDNEGNISSAEIYHIYKYAVNAGDFYVFSGKSGASNTFYYVNWFDSEENFISHQYYSTYEVAYNYVDELIQAPSNAAYLYLNVQNSQQATYNAKSTVFYYSQDLYDEISKNAVSINTLSNIILSENTVETEYVANSTSAKIVSGSFPLSSGKKYRFTAEFLDEPTENAQVNVWIYKEGDTPGGSGMVARVILRGGDEWSGPRTSEFVPPENANYEISYRCIKGGAQTARIAASVNNPFYDEGGEDESEKNLPAYYFPYIENRVVEAKRQLGMCGRGSTAMFFITDTHHPQNYDMSGSMLRYINEQLQVRMTVYGGDVCPSYTSNWSGVDDPIEAIALSDNALTKLLSNSKGKIFRLKGNHDYSIANVNYWQSGKQYYVGNEVILSSAMTSGGDNHIYTCVTANNDDTFDPEKWLRGNIGGHNLSQIESQRLILAEAEDSGICVFPENSDACYYYFDVPKSKLRFICWDNCDSDRGFTGISNVTQNVSNEQFRWIIENAILTTPSGYSIVSFGHIPTYPNLSPSNLSYNTATWNVNRRNLIKAVNGKTSVTIGGQTYNFSGFVPNIITDISGHTHWDQFTSIDGLMGITIAGDWWSNEIQKSPIYRNFGLTSSVSRVAGTVTEQAFDLIIFDIANNYIKFIRFGAGIDRYVNIEKKTVSIGSTLQITSSLSGTLEYCVLDSDLRERNSDGAYRPTTTRASIDSNGVLTPISAGEVVVFVYDSDNNIAEIIGVKIE